MNISKENINSEVLKKYGPSVVTTIGVTGMVASTVINRKRQEELADAYSYMDASYELYKEEVKRNRGIIYRVREFFKRLFHK